MATMTPEDEIFWSKICDAYNLVTTQANLTTAVTVGDKCAEIRDNGDTIVITISEVEVKPPTLVVP